MRNSIERVFASQVNQYHHEKKTSVQNVAAAANGGPNYHSA